MKELIERLRNDCYQEDEVRAHVKEAADALERMTAERDSLKEGLDGWHARYLDCEVERDVEKEHVRQCVANIAKPMTDEEIDDALSDIWGSDTGEVLSAHLQRKIARAIEARMNRV